MSIMLPNLYADDDNGFGHANRFSQQHSLILEKFRSCYSYL